MIVAKVLEIDTVTCPSCNTTFDAWDLDVGTDWFFEWDNYDSLTGEQLRNEPINQDCCFNCVNKCKEDFKRERESKCLI